MAQYGLQLCSRIPSYCRIRSRIELESNRLIQAQILFLKSRSAAVSECRERDRRKPSRAGTQAMGRNAVRHWRATPHGSMTPEMASNFNSEVA
jgi:hypothetical protein